LTPVSVSLVSICMFLTQSEEKYPAKLLSYI
jgi:hypothetical protein